MLARIVRESLTRGRRRKLLSGVAVALGITVATTLATLALDVGDKVSRELRSFGANISVTPAALWDDDWPQNSAYGPGRQSPSDSLRRLEARACPLGKGLPRRRFWSAESSRRAGPKRTR